MAHVLYLPTLIVMGLMDTLLFGIPLWFALQMNLSSIFYDACHL